MNTDNIEIRNIRAFLTENRSQADAAVFEALLQFIHDTVGAPYRFPYWFPLYELNCGIPAAVFDLDSIYRNADIDQLRDTLALCGIDHASAFQFQLTDKGLHLHTVSLPQLLYQKDADGFFDFPWEVETYYFDSSKAWLIYVSHEDTISFAGSSIVQAAEAAIRKQYRK